MPRIYRMLQQWDHWLSQPLGQNLIREEASILESSLLDKRGMHLTLIGVPSQQALLKHHEVMNQIVMGPLVNSHPIFHYVETNFQELPVQSTSMDLVLLPHTLEFLDNPRQLLTESCRIVKPEGHLLILGFNPYSLWGLKRWWDRDKTTFSRSHFISVDTIKKWLILADFELVQQKGLLFRPPIVASSLDRYFQWMEWLGQKSHLPFGSVYLLIAKAKSIPLTPIRLRWKQALSGAAITPRIYSGTLRNSS